MEKTTPETSNEFVTDKPKTSSKFTVILTSAPHQVGELQENGCRRCSFVQVVIKFHLFVHKIDLQKPKDNFDSISF